MQRAHTLLQEYTHIDTLIYSTCMCRSPKLLGSRLKFLTVNHVSSSRRAQGGLRLSKSVEPIIVASVVATLSYNPTRMIGERWTCLVDTAAFRIVPHSAGGTTQTRVRYPTIRSPLAEARWDKCHLKQQCWDEYVTLTALPTCLYAFDCHN